MSDTRRREYQRKRKVIEKEGLKRIQLKGREGERTITEAGR
jgi:hypothetical protein